jgi:outer membrane protein assembly factor BamB
LIPRIRPSRLLFFVSLALLITACGGGHVNWAGVTASEGNEIYVSFGRFIARLDAEGKQVWSYPDEESRKVEFYAPVTLVDDKVYVGDYRGGVHAINRETGEEIWVYEQSGTEVLGLANFGGTPDRITGSIEPGVYQGKDVLFVPDEDGVFMIDPATGERQDGLLVETDRAVWAKPVFVTGESEQPDRLFVSSLDHFLYAINLETGKQLWKTELDGAIPGSPVFDSASNTLLVGSFGSEVVAINADNGAIISTYSTEGWVWETPAWVDGVLYFSDLMGYLYAVQYQDAQFREIWKKQLSAEGKLRATPLVTDEFVVIGSSDGKVFAVQRETGEQEWEENLELEMVSALNTVVSGEEILVVTATNESDKLLVGLQLDSGNETWSYKHES